MKWKLVPLIQGWTKFQVLRQLWFWEIGLHLSMTKIWFWMSMLLYLRSPRCLSIFKMNCPFLKPDHNCHRIKLRATTEVMRIWQLNLVGMLKLSIIFQRQIFLRGSRQSIGNLNQLTWNLVIQHMCSKYTLIRLQLHWCPKWIKMMGPHHKMRNLQSLEISWNNRTLLWTTWPTYHNQPKQRSTHLDCCQL